VYKLSRTILVNEPSKTTLSRHDVWAGLLMKANNALPYVPIMSKCEVIERGEGWLTRDILLKDVPLREKVSFEPESRVIFDRIGGDELGRIENIIGEDEKGNLTLTFSFGLTKKGIPEGSDAEQKHFAQMEGAYFGAVASTLAAVRRTVDEARAAAADWTAAFFRDADTLVVETLISWFAETVEVRFGNGAPIHGRAAAEQAFRQFYGSLSGMRHRREVLVSSGDLAAQMAVVTYIRQDGSEVSMPVASHLRRVGDRKIDRLWIFIDLAPLFGAADNTP
jgi:ketosteroid isomerase-like protein